MITNQRILISKSVIFLKPRKRVLKMDVSIDGLRRSATGSMNNLADVIESICSQLSDSETEELIEAFDSAATSVDVFNCVYDNSIENFSDLSDKLEIRRLEPDIS